MSALSELNKEIERCQQCDLARYRTRVVPGEGAAEATIMFIGEAPGWHEDQQGRPFVGSAGHFLDELLISVGLKRGEVYIANVVKCRPPANRDPAPAEMQACRGWLDRQIELIRPKMVVCLGRYSTARFFPGESIGKVHGTARRQDDIIYYAMYHPAAALHQQSLRQAIEEDMQRIPQVLAEAEKVSEAKQPPEQLSLL